VRFGPALAGALLTVTGPGLIFALNGACTLVVLGAVASLRSTAQAQPVEGNGFAQLTGGISYLRSHRPVLWLEGVLLIAMTGVLGVETLLPVFATGTWHAGPAGYGLLRTAPGIAAVLAGLSLSLFPGVGRGAVTIGIAFAGASAGMAAFAAGPPFALALFLLASASLCLAATQVIAGTMVQQAIPDALRGRISALGSAGQNGLAGLAAAATSAVALPSARAEPSPPWPRPSPARASFSPCSSRALPVQHRKTSRPNVSRLIASPTTELTGVASSTRADN
jgi:Transmembrane secretion effector